MYGHFPDVRHCADLSEGSEDKYFWMLSIRKEGNMEIKLYEVEGEYRDGYYVQSMMKRIWAVQIDILKVIDAICRRCGIRYYGWFGTLLGAVRHQGFIPWDDDIDLAMLREDYEKFQYNLEAELPEGWKVLKEEPTLLRILNTDVIRIDQEFLDRYHGCPYATGIDIFCLDYIPRGEEKENLWLNLFLAVYGLYKYWDYFDGDGQWMAERLENLKEIEKLTGCHFNENCSVKKQLYELADRTAAMYQGVESDEVTSVSWLYDHQNYRIPKSCFNKVIEVPFENVRIPILEDYDLVCTMTYGTDYMTPIKEHEHGSVKVQVDILREYFRKQGCALPECLGMKFG